MRQYINLVESIGPAGIQRVTKEATAYAESLGVILHLDEYHNGLMLGIYRKGEHGPAQEAPVGNGAKVMQNLCRLADDYGVKLFLDVDKSIPRLIRYYWQFGFRGWTSGEDDAKEKAKFAAHEAEWNAFVAADPDEDDYIVATMDRTPFAKPVV